MDKKIDTVLVVFSATLIHRELAMRALDVAEQNNARLIILSVRDKNIAEKVTKMTMNHGFLGKNVVDKLKEDIVKDRNEMISRKLKTVEKEAQRRGIAFETVRVKGDFVEELLKITERYLIDVLLLDNKGKLDELKKTVQFDIISVG